MRPLSYLYSISLRWQAENYSLPGGPYPAVLVGNKNKIKKGIFLDVVVGGVESGIRTHARCNPPSDLVDHSLIAAWVSPQVSGVVRTPEIQRKEMKNEERSLVVIIPSSRTQNNHILLHRILLD